MSDTQSGNDEKSKSLREMVTNFIWQDDGDGRGKEIRWNVYLGAAVILGLVVVTAYTFHGATSWQSTATGFLIAGAALAAGILVGFLFGIPRVRQQTTVPTDSQSPTEPLAANTNLEQISDWLTKIIVGVGLVQLTKIPGTMKRLADYLSGAFGAAPAPSALVISIIGYFGIFGFLLGYLWARIYLTGEFSRVERLTKDRPEYYEGLIHAYLYQPMPQGFQNAIKIGKQYIQRFGDNERVWTYLACAYGQQHAYRSRAAKPKQPEVKESRDNAFDAVDKAIQIDAEARSFLRGLWVSDAKPPENDLASLYDDEEFKQIFREPATKNSNAERQ
jgi:hypothetical protein